MSCQQVPTAPAFNPYPRSVQVGEFEVAIGGGIWVAIGVYPRCFAQHLNRPPLEMDEPALTHVQIKIGKIQTARYVEVHYP